LAKSVVVRKNKVFVYEFERERLTQNFLDIKKILDAVAGRLVAVDTSTLSEYYHLLQVPRGSKVHYYHRTCKIVDGEVKQARWFGRMGSEKAEKALQAWLKERALAEKVVEIENEIEKARNYLLLAESKLRRVLKELQDVSLEVN